MQPQAEITKDGPCYVQRQNGDSKIYQGGNADAVKDGNGFLFTVGIKKVFKKATKKTDNKESQKRAKFLACNGAVMLLK